MFTVQQILSVCFLCFFWNEKLFIIFSVQMFYVWCFSSHIWGKYIFFFFALSINHINKFNIYQLRKKKSIIFYLKSWTKQKKNQNPQCSLIYPLCLHHLSITFFPNTFDRLICLPLKMNFKFLYKKSFIWNNDIFFWSWAQLSCIPL